jgi:hypothetical protein
MNPIMVPISNKSLPMMP